MVKIAAAFTLMVSATAAVAQPCPEGWLFGPDQGVPGIDGFVWQALTHDDGTGRLLYCCGRNLRPGELPSGNLVRFRDGAWEHVGGDVDGEARALAEFRGDLIVGGHFESAGGVPIRNLARWDGQSWHGLGLALEPHHEVRSLGVVLGQLAVSIASSSEPAPAFRTVLWDGDSWRPMAQDPALFAEAFTEIYGRIFALTSVPGRAREVSLWNGADWERFGDLFDVRDLAEYGGDLVVSGNFRIVNGTVLNGVARWDGHEWQPFGEGLPYEQIGDLLNHRGNLYVAAFVSGNQYAVLRWTGGEWVQVGEAFSGSPRLAGYGDQVVAVGDIRSLGPSAAMGVARWDGTAWRAFGTGFDDYVDHLWLYGDRAVFDGAFKRAGPLESPPFALWDGAQWTTLPRPGRDVEGLVEFRGELIAAGGEFQFPAQPSPGFVARWTGAGWAPLGDGPTDRVGALHIHDGLLYAGGKFVQAGGGPASRIAVWNGSAWGPVGSGLDDTVYAMTTWEGKLVVSAGRPHQIRTWDGRAWGSLPPLPNLGVEAVTSLVVFDGDLIAEHSQPSDPVRRFNGTAWESMGLTNGQVGALTEWQGSLYVGGSYLAPGGSWPGTGTLARWDGRSWEVIDGLGSTGQAHVRAMVPLGSQLILAGNIDTADGRVSHQWARWGCERCYPDCDQSTGLHVLDIFDFLCFQNRFAEGRPYACDCDRGSGPGVCDVFDFLCFQNAYTAGCR